MPALSPTSPRNAKLSTGLWAGQNQRRPVRGGENNRNTNETFYRPTGRIDWPAILHSIWPAKTALELSLATGCSQRHAERVISGSRGLSDQSVVALLRSHVGLAIWRALMAGSAETWWQELESDREYAQAERRLAELRRRREDFDRGR